MKVLLVDDRQRARASLRALLQTESSLCIVGEAANGRKAIEGVESKRPDVVLMDVRMPVMDGLEATRQIKADWPETRVVLLTMFGGYEEQARAAGADALLTKGCPPAELLTAMLQGKEKPHVPKS